MIGQIRGWTRMDLCTALFFIWTGVFVTTSRLASAETPAMCQVPKLTTHLRTDVTRDTIYGTEATFWCDKGYVLKGANTSQCTSEGQWKPHEPFCEKAADVTCDVPVCNPYVLHNVTSFPVFPGTVVGYMCDIGYILVGPTNRFCNQFGKWTGTDPVCAAKVSAGRRVAKISQNVDFTTPPLYRGIAILDDNNYRCSIADAADRMESYWTIDLLEKQSIDVVVLIFKDHINITINLFGSWQEDDLKPQDLKKDDYSSSEWRGLVELGALTTYEYRFKKSVGLRYLTVHIPKTDESRIFLCESMILSKQASSYGQCLNTKYVRDPKVSLTAANGTCFTVVQSKQDTWWNANGICQDLTNNGTLASHVTLDQQRLLTSHLSILSNNDEDKFWIGGHANPNSKGKEDWKWLDDSPIRESFWGQGQPSMNAGFKPCVALGQQMQWNWDDQPCEDHHYFICKHGLLSCGQPDVAANTFVEGSRLRNHATVVSAIGTKVVYKCPKDYEMVGNKERVCQVGGKWSGRSPSCWKKDDPNHPEHQKKDDLKAKGLPVGAIAAIIAGVILGLLLIVAIILFISYKKKRGGATMKYSKKSESAETLDVDEKKTGGGKTNYASTEPTK